MATPQYVVGANAKPAVCKFCDGEIFWVRTEYGKPVPVNADGVVHFNVCVGAENYRLQVNSRKAQDALIRVSTDNGFSIGYRQALSDVLEALSNDLWSERAALIVADMLRKQADT